MKVSPEIREAISSNKPVVALESTIYTHGFPHPENQDLAASLERLVRDHGAIPATVGILKGKAVVGLSRDQLTELLSNRDQLETLKVSRRDLGFICGRGIQGRLINGGTTVAATSLLAHSQGIRVFATGGLGGVHRYGESTMDVSADLTELGRTPIAIVSSGCKSFLDIGRTLEYLETQGVFVGTFRDGRTGSIEFPAFFSRNSGFPSPYTIEDERDAAAIIHSQSTLGLKSGMFFANPVPQQFEIPKQQMEAVFTQAIEEARKKGFDGSKNTPYILSRSRELTRGATVIANRALIQSNVIRGAEIAVELARLSRNCQSKVATSMTSKLPSEQKETAFGQSSRRSPVMRNSLVDVAVAGSVAVDLSCDFSEQGSSSISSPKLGTSNPARIGQSLGGVGYNVAAAAYYFTGSVKLVSVVGNDIAGKTVTKSLKQLGMDTSRVVVHSDSNQRTSQYIAINSANKALLFGIADMKIMDEISGKGQICPADILPSIRPKWLIVDANWSSGMTRAWLEAAKLNDIPVAFEPVSVFKSQRLFQGIEGKTEPLGVFPQSSLTIASPNAAELSALHGAAQSLATFQRLDWLVAVESMNIASSEYLDRLVSLTNKSLVGRNIPQQSLELAPLIPCLLTKLGSEGVLLTQALSHDDPRLRNPETSSNIIWKPCDRSTPIGGLYLRHFPAIEEVYEEDVVSVNGAGDTFLGVVIAGLAKLPQSHPEDWIDIGQKASVMTLKSRKSVSPSIKSLRLSASLTSQ
ncbi:MAG: hypothetical protein M1814_005533 [Vezdaea aestivalis]|nr:MAG: hypothetical protein M1814_005533 [Vezdaea aestivalis]